MIIEEKNAKKKELLEEFFSERLTDNLLGENLVKKLNSFIEENGYDQNIDDALTLQKLYIMENEAAYYEEATEIIAPVVERLLNKTKLDDLDVTFGSVVITNTKTYEQAIEIAEKIFQYDGLLEETKVTAFLNLSIRLVKAKFTEHIDLEKLTKDFYSYIEQAIELCEKSKIRYHNFIYYHMLLLRKATFEKDDEAISEHLKALKDEKSLIKILRQEVEEIKSYRSNSVARVKANKKIGKNLRRLRKERNLTLEDVSQHLGISIVNAGKHETGMRNIAVEHIYKLADFMNISVESLFYNTKDEDGKLTATKNNINSMLDTFSEEELHLVSDAVAIMKKFTELEKMKK